MKRACAQFQLTAPIKYVYCTRVRSILEYTSILWDPHTINFSYILEHIQSKFLYFAGHIN